MITRKYKYHKGSDSVVEVTRPGVRPVDAPYVQDDTIPPTVSHATDEGRVFTSRAALYAHYKEHGFECTGGSHLTGKSFTDFEYKSDIEDVRADLYDTYNKLQWGMIPLTEKEKEGCLREARAYRDYVRRQSR